MNDEKQRIHKFSLSAELTEKSDYSPPNNRAEAYAVPPPEHIEHPVLTTPNISINVFSQLRTEPVQCACVYCHSMITTRISHRPGLLVWFACFALILFGLWFGCCLIPFCISQLHNTRHFCPNCQKFLGEYRPL